MRGLVTGSAVLVGLVVAVAMAIASADAPNRVADAWSRLHAPSQDSAARDLSPAGSHGVSTEALVLARESIPAGATVAVVVGPPSVLDPGVAAAVPGTMCDWLLPRRCVSEIASADWVITYHVPSESLPVKGREIGLGPDANAVEVAR